MRQRGPGKVFFVINVFHRGLYGPTSRCIWTQGLQLLLERVPYQKFYSKETYCDLWELSGSVVECLTRDRGFEPHERHCVVVFEQDTFILA